MNENIRQAVALVFRYKSEVFYIKRQNYLKAFPGYTAFPGGKVDKKDIVDSLDNTLLNTLKREALEELKINIDELQNAKIIKSISKIAKATSPSFNPLRYETYFFEILLNEKMILRADKDEAAEYGWKDAYNINADFNNGERLIVAPIRKLLNLISEAKKTISYVDLDEIREKTVLPQIEVKKDLYQIMPLSNTVPPATRTNCFVYGSQEHIVCDPSPKTIDEYRKLIEALSSFFVSKIFITHHHKDHHQYSVSLAKYFNAPMTMSKFTFNQILKVYGEDYFDDIKIEFIKGGDILGNWRGQDVLVYEIPGHDEGHLGIAPRNLEWFIVGDLFQGIGTVVVGGEESSMTKYFASLNKVIDLSPQCVIPSHGIALGGTYILERTLKHRELRENQVLELFKEGKTKDEILRTLYFDLPKKLHRYALANIESHILKLKEEGKI